MDGVIYVVLVAGWLLYLVPQFLLRRDRPVEAEPEAPFSSAMRIVRHADDDPEAVRPDLEVSTPLTRRAQLWELDQIQRSAARRRRSVLIFLGLALVSLIALAVLHRVPAWTAAIPVGLVVAFLGVARFSVRAMRRSLDRRADLIVYGDGSDEPTVSLALPATDADRSVEIDAPIEMQGSLWDPVPVTAATYVQQPLAPRTVRTIDLSAPVADAPRVPPTADRPDGRPYEPAVEEEPAWGRAVGE